VRRAPLVALAVACLLTARSAAASPHVIAAGREESIKALFGAVWGGKTGDLRLTDARVDASRVVVHFVASERRAELVLVHPDDLDASDPDLAFTVVDRDKGLAVTAACTPGCSSADARALHQTADDVIARYQGGLFVASSPSDGSPAQRPARPGPSGPRGRAAWRVSAALLALASLLTALVAGRRARAREPLPPRLLADALLVLGATIVAAIALTEPGLANWYVDLLPASGDGRALADQLGPGALVIESVARAALPWTDRTLFALTLVASSLGSALWYVALRALDVPRATCLLAAALGAVSPLPARAAWSGGPHAFVFALHALLLVAWIRAQRPGAWADRALALVLVMALPLLRVDAIVFAATPLLFTVARDGWRRRLGLATGYVVVLACAAALTWELVVLPSGAHVPDASERAATARSLLVDFDLVGQLFAEPARSAWFPRPLAWLVVAGAVTLALRRPALLAGIVVALAAPEIALARLVNGEGLIGCRYFLPAFPLLALLAAAPLGPLARPTAKRWGLVAAAVGAAALTVGAAWPMYHRRYTYQDEYAFLRAALASAPRPARVFHVAVHDDPILVRDPDCCLNPSRSPLVLALPSLDFEPLEVDPAAGPLPDTDEPAAYYYESAICSYGPTEETERRNPGLALRLRDRCARLARDPRLVPIASATVPARAAWRLFPTDLVTVRLFRIDRGVARSPAPP
jgi:hypothetical protein